MLPIGAYCYWYESDRLRPDVPDLLDKLLIPFLKPLKQYAFPEVFGLYFPL